MSELFAAILAAPAEDEPRLVYADWLVERGDPRGELIQLQCTLGRVLRGATLYSGAVKGTRAELEAREKALLKKHQKAWLAPIRPWIRTWTWHRGFVDSVVADAVKFLDHAAEIFAATPLLGAQLTRLPAKEVARVAATAELGRLERFDLSQNRIGPKAMRSLVGPVLGAMADLDLWGNPLAGEGLEALATVPFTRLRRLRLATCKAQGTGVAALAKAPWFGALEALDLRFNDEVGPLAAAAIARAGTSLRALDVSKCCVGDEGAVALASSPAMAHLEALWIFGNGVGDHGAVALIESPHLVKLKHVVGLVGYGSTLSPEVAARLKERFDVSQRSFDARD
jgi:uncharacterized protein (TIGR02996 family)